ncbi:MAG: glycoside hydrolase [Candidatus Omnitrophica bacterium]|nr:glycoside hydrolase [Candidatus Omnitrophota bacterium]
MLFVIFLWHMHQPWTLDPDGEGFLLPWVRLHGTKDYLDMAHLLKEFPRIHGVINTTPCLLEQVQLYGQGVQTGKPVQDRHQILSRKPAEDLAPSEVAELLQISFLGSPERMIHPYPPYYTLMAKAQRKQVFSAQELRDLQVWSNLVWMDPRWGRDFPWVAELAAKGSSFTEGEKEELLKLQMELLAKIIPAYRALQESGQVELSTSPWAHPILPLLADTDVIRQTNPGMLPPAERFQFLEDVAWHLKAAAEQYANWFGRSPKGLWPSEGSLSQTVLPEVAKAGFHWAATDEELLWKSLDSSSHDLPSRAALYQPYRVPLGDRSLTLLFRDHLLSDLIGFVYSGWPAQKAVDDFTARLRGIERSIPSQAPGLVLVALDGENPWEFYPEDGEPFLRALYQGLSQEESIRCVTASEFLEKYPAQNELKGLSPGSWIRGEFSTWIGHEPQNRAWEELAKVRRLIGPQASKAIAVAEGSDWFWWLGPEHSSPQDPIFEVIFRSYLKNAYRTAGETAPPSLEEPLKPFSFPVTAPGGLITPAVDGEISSYFEWLQAGEVELTHTGSAMARAKPVFSKFWWGWDASCLYFRLDPTGSLRELNVEVTLHDPHFQVKFALNRGIVKGPLGPILAAAKGGRTISNLQVMAAAGKILEIGIPLHLTGVSREEKLKLTILVEQEGGILERYPEHGQLSLTLPDPLAGAELWSA